MDEEKQAQVDVIFNPDVYDGLQRKYTVEIGPKKEECYGIEGVQASQKLNFHFMVKVSIN